MSKVSRDLYRKKLSTLLGRADDDSFLRLAWSISALQAGHVEAASNYMRFRPDAIGADNPLGCVVMPWMLETLVNEFLCAPKERRYPGRLYRVMDCSDIEQMLAAQRLLSKLENADSGLTLQHIGILEEMRRATQRQFEFQRDIVNVAHLYRSFSLYADGKADLFLQQKHGISVNDLSLAGFALYSSMTSELLITGAKSLDEIGLTADICARALKVLAQTTEQAKVQARQTRRTSQPTAYRPSVLRRFPILKLDHYLDAYLSPMPRLIIQRVTSGLFFDLFGADGGVRTEVGTRFEDYCYRLFTKILPNYEVSKEFAYGSKKLGKRTPDVLIEYDRRICMVVECKSVELTFDAKYSDDQVAAATNKLERIGKGIFQIWKFFSHLRQGLIANKSASPEAFGIILSLEDWFTMSRLPITKMFENANRQCDESADEILECDKRPIVLSWIEDIEFFQRTCDANQFHKIMCAAHSKEYRGWHMPALVQELFPDSTTQNPYAFIDDFGQQTWWQKLSFLRLEAESP
jgi:hypothetical protein